MSIGFLSFVYKAVSSQWEKPEAPTIHSLRPTSHTQHCQEGLTPNAISTFTTTSSLFHSSPPSLPLPSPPSPSLLTSAHPYHSASLSHLHPLTSLDLQRDADQAESLCLSSSPTGYVHLFDVALRRPLDALPHPHVSAVAVVQTSPLSSFQQPSSAYPLFLSASSSLLLAHAYCARQRGYGAHAVSLPLVEEEGEVALSLHPSSLYFSWATPASFALVDLHNLRVLLTVPLPPISPSSSPSSPYPLPSSSPPTPLAEFAPSGRQLAVSTASSLLLYDPLHLPSPTLSLPSPSLSPLTSTAFSPSGHLLALGTSAGSMRILDLRRVRGQPHAEPSADGGSQEALQGEVVASVQAPHPEGEGEVAPALSCLRFDDSGSYLFAALGRDVVVYDTASWQEVARYTTPAPLTGLRLGRDGSWWVTTDVDGRLTLYGHRTK